MLSQQFLSKNITLLRSYTTTNRTTILIQKLFPYTSEVCVTNKTTSIDITEDRPFERDPVVRIAGN